MSLVAAILLFGVIILIHELGHFLFAKRGGICVVEFSLGMGPRLFSFEKGGTKYSLKLFPFGGSCMMLGENDDISDESSEEKAREHISEKAAYTEETKSATKELEVSEYQGVSFNETSVWTRFSVIAAGPIFNFILAFVCAIFIIGYVGYDPAEINGIVEGSAAESVGMMPGDVITEINGKNIHMYRDILAYTLFNPGKTMDIEYTRGNQTYESTVVPKYSAEDGRYLIGISGQTEYRKPESILTTLRYSLYEVKYQINMVFSSLGMIVKRQVSADDIAGPVRIVSMIDDTVKQSSEYGFMVVFVNLANMCLLLSANLGIMNLLPIPALDGGRLVFILLEAVRGKPIDREKEGMIHMVGMMVLMVLMVFILFNDIRNLL